MFAVQHISKSFEDRSVLEDVNFAVHAGEVIALIGENGAGKTTLLQIILVASHDRYFIETIGVNRNLLFEK